LLVYPQYKVRLHRYKGQRYVDQYQGATTLWNWNMALYSAQTRSFEFRIDRIHDLMAVP
jgi:hypothetical protein